MQRAQKRKRYGMKGRYPTSVAKRSFRSYKKSNVLLSAKNFEKLRCESIIYVRATAGSQYVITQSGNTVWNVAEFVNSFSWTQNQSDFLKYKITGIAVRAVPTHDDSELSDGMCSLPINIAFYPNYINYGVPHLEVMGNDNAFRIDPNISGIQSKYWSFPDGYYETSSTGFGIWVSSNSASAQVGQLSVGNSPPFVNFGIDKCLYMLRISVYLTMGYRRG